MADAVLARVALYSVNVSARGGANGNHPPRPADAGRGPSQFMHGDSRALAPALPANWETTTTRGCGSAPPRVARYAQR
eukprot:639069-Prymnesium_polylepis.1